MSSKAVVLIGLPGSGKTTLGKALHEHLGWSWVDVDAVVEGQVGRSITELIRVEGEQKFRGIEASVLADAIGRRVQVVSVGGGALMQPASSKLVEENGFAVYLRVGLESAVDRVLSDEGAAERKRPVLFGDGTEVSVESARTGLTKLAEKRAEQYGRAKLSVWTDFATPKRIAETIAGEMTSIEKVTGKLSVIPDTHSKIVVGEGVRRTLGKRIREEFPKVRKVIVAIDENVAAKFGKEIDSDLKEEGLDFLSYLVPSGETSKSSNEVFKMIGAMAEAELTRDDLLVGVGGGVVGDVSGFAASVYLRGIDHIQVPTTVVAQVDSAIGGKTAVNLEQGKNLAGTFHPAKIVLCDPEFLKTLPEREYLSGLAEVVKYGLIFSADFYEELEGNIELIKKRDTAVLSRIVEQSALFKTGVVAKDLHDRLGLRALLNFGHTVGHAIEKLCGYGELLHGEAVAIGMVQALKIGVELKITPADLTEKVALLLRALNLPTAVPKKLLAAESLQVRWEKALRADKKRGSAGLMMILLERLGTAKVVAVELQSVVSSIASQQAPE